MKQFSENENKELIYDFSIGAEKKKQKNKKKIPVKCVISGYVCYSCNNKIWIGMVLEIWHW